MRLIVPLLLAGQPLLAIAADGESKAVTALPDPLGGGALLMQLLLGLGAVIGLILLLAWLARRVNLVPGQRGDLQVVAVLPLGQRERAVLIQVGEQQLLLGVSGQQVTLLERFERPVVEPRQAPQGAFARRLQEVIRQRGGQN